MSLMPSYDPETAWEMAHHMMQLVGMNGEFVGDEWHTACIFCSPRLSGADFKDYVKSPTSGNPATGRDRFVLQYAHEYGGHCRQCNNSYSYDMLLRRLRFLLRERNIAIPSVYNEMIQKNISERRKLMEQIARGERLGVPDSVVHQLNQWHLYEAAFKELQETWNSASIFKFCGYGEIEWRYLSTKETDGILHDVFAIRLNRMVDLKNFKPLFGEFEALLDPIRTCLELRFTFNKEKRKVHTRGTDKRNAVNFVSDGLRKGDTRLAITEGAKDMVTAWDIGYRNVIPVLGVTSVSYEALAKFVEKSGITDVDVFGDNDQAGFAFNLGLAANLRRRGLKVRTIEWPSEEKDGTDISDIRKRIGSAEQSRSYVEANLVETISEAALSAYAGSTFVQDYEDIEANTVSLESLREGEGSIAAQIDRVVVAGNKKIVNVFGYDAGAGKTHATVNYLYRRALTEDAQRDPNLPQQRRARFLFLTPFRHSVEDIKRMLPENNEENVFYFSAREPENCKQFNVAQRLGQMNHSIGAYCNLQCPAKEWCKKQGYLAQHEKMLDYPMVVMRHHHFVNQAYGGGWKLMVFDENPIDAVFGKEVSFSSTDLHAHSEGWEQDVANSQSVKQMVTAVRAVMDENRHTEEIVKGALFFHRVDMFLRRENRLTLEILMAKITPDDVEEYQPNNPFIHEDELNNLALRCFPQLYRQMWLEWGSYRVDPKGDWPSAIWLQKGTLQVRDTQPLWVSKRTKVVVLDATPSALIYKAIFREREVDIERRHFENPNAQFEQIIGEQFTRSALNKQLYRQLKTAESAANVEMTKDGSRVTLNLQPQDQEFASESELWRFLYTSIQYLAQNYKSVLVFSHKPLRVLLEYALKKNPEFANVSFEHYQATRGTNKYEDFEAVALFGIPQIPPEERRREVETLFRLADIMQSVGDSMQSERALQLTEDAERETGVDKTNYWTFSDPLADDHVCMREEGELEQALSRIRPRSTSNKKAVFIFSNRPISRVRLNKVSKTSAWRNKLYGSKDNALALEIIEAIKAGADSQNDLKVTLKVGYPRLKRVLAMLIDSEDLDTLEELIEKYKEKV